MTSSPKMSCKKLCQYFHEGPGLSFSFKYPQELKKTFKPSALKSGHGLKMSLLKYDGGEGYYNVKKEGKYDERVPTHD